MGIRFLEVPHIICSLENAMSSDQRSSIDLHTGLPLIRPETPQEKRMAKWLRVFSHARDGQHDVATIDLTSTSKIIHLTKQTYRLGSGIKLLYLQCILTWCDMHRFIHLYRRHCGCCGRATLQPNLSKLFIYIGVL